MIAEATYTVVCDECGIFTTTLFLSDDRGIDKTLEKDGWLVEDGTHTCPNCLKNETE